MHPDDHLDLDRQLRELRPHLPEERLHLRAARARTAVRRSRTSTHGTESFMRSRLAILLVLVFGFALSGAGAGLAVSGFSQTASTSQYQGVGGETDEDNGDLGDDFDDETPTPANEDNGTAGTEDTTTTQELRQVGAEQGGTLPFTGFAAIPILLAGLVLVGTGLVLRRRTGADPR